MQMQDGIASSGIFISFNIGRGLLRASVEHQQGSYRNQSRHNKHSKDGWLGQTKRKLLTSKTSNQEQQHAVTTMRSQHATMTNTRRKGQRVGVSISTTTNVHQQQQEQPGTCSINEKQQQDTSTTCNKDKHEKQIMATSNWMAMMGKHAFVQQ